MKATDGGLVHSPIRLGFDARYISDRYHGIGRYAFRLLEAMVSLAPDWGFVVFTGKDRNSRFDLGALSNAPNVELQPGPWPLYWPQEQLRWPGVLRRAGVNRFYSPYFVGPLFSGVPWVITVHDLIFDRYPDYMPMRWSRPYYRLLMVSSTRRARRVAVVSRATAADLREFYGVPPERTEVVMDAADPQFRNLSSSSQLSELRRRYDLKGPFVLAVGTRRPHKNYGHLVSAFSGLVKAVEHDLVFVGPPDIRFPDEAKEIVRQKGLSDRVRFLEWVPEPDLPGLYALADLVAMPSLVEGFGLPVLEAMASGTPVLASNVSSLPEIVEGAGHLVDPRDCGALQDAMYRLLKDAQLRRRLAEAGRTRAASFTWEASAQRLIHLIKAAVP